MKQLDPAEAVPDSSTEPVSRGAASREAILGAAIRVVGREGLPAASLGAIAREAGASKPAVLYHFGSREKLLREMAARALEHFHDGVFESARQVHAGRARLAMEAVFSKENRLLLAAVRELMSLGLRDAVVGASVRSSFEELDRMVALLLPGPPENALQTAMQVVRCVHGYVELWLCSGEEDPGPYREGAMRVALKLVRSPELY